MYGLIGKITAKPGTRDELIALLLEGASAMPGCLGYVVAKDAADDGTIWVTETWESEALHHGSLSLPNVKHAIEKAMPLIAGFEALAKTEPVGGHGLVPASASSPGPR